MLKFRGTILKTSMEGICFTYVRISQAVSASLSPLRVSLAGQELVQLKNVDEKCKQMKNSRAWPVHLLQTSGVSGMFQSTA